MDALPSVSVSNEVCPSCGEFATLDEYTGFCKQCSKGSTGVERLVNNFETSLNKLEQALAANADAIDHYLSTGTTQSTYQALALARQDRAICLVCGNPIPRASRNAVFCRKNAECRRYSRRYVYLYTEQGKSKTEALAIILDELT